MSELLIPDDRRPYPTLGPGVCDWMEASLNFGPGDLRGKPYVLDEEDRAIVYSLYEVYPRDHPLAGRRCYDTAMLMLRKGTKKSERAGAIIAAELAADSPVRCDGFRGRQPIGRPITDPYIPVVAYSEQQAEDTAFSALYVMLSEGPAADQFDFTLERIMRVTGDGKAEALATAPDSRDGGRTTFQVKEETHRWTLPRQLEAHQTMTANLAKRPIAEPWELHVTTAYRPGEGSLAELMHATAKKLAAKPLADQRAARFWFFYRWADEKIRIYGEDGGLDPTGLRAAIVDASGPVQILWSDPDRIANQWTLPAPEPDYAERVWLNRVKQAGSSAFNVERWKELARPDYTVARGAVVVGGFDGSKVDDLTALIATEVLTGFQWPIGIWDPAEFGNPHDPEVQRRFLEAVNVAFDDFMNAYSVWRVYVDPPYWKDELAAWQGRYGEKVVLPWETWRTRAAGFMIRNYISAIAAGHLAHSGDPVFTSHIGHARKRLLNERDDKGERLFTIQKERADSQDKIDAAMGGGLSWEARTDAIAEGVGAPKKPSIYERRGIHFLGGPRPPDDNDTDLPEDA
jgi:hypothetical protein